MSDPFDAVNRALARSFEQTKEMVGDDNLTVALHLPTAQFLALMFDEWDKVVGICAVGQGNYVEVRLDTVQLRTFRDELTAALTRGNVE